MRKFLVQEFDDQQGYECIVSEKEIEESYFPYWKSKMLKVGKEDLISFENCLEDWIIVNWAKEIT